MLDIRPEHGVSALTLTPAKYGDMNDGSDALHELKCANG